MVNFDELSGRLNPGIVQLSSATDKWQAYCELCRFSRIMSQAEAVEWLKNHEHTLTAPPSSRLH